MDKSKLLQASLEQCGPEELQQLEAELLRLRKQFTIVRLFVQALKTRLNQVPTVRPPPAGLDDDEESLGVREDQLDDVVCRMDALVTESERQEEMQPTSFGRTLAEPANATQPGAGRPRTKQTVVKPPLAPQIIEYLTEHGTTSVEILAEALDRKPHGIRIAAKRTGGLYIDELERVVLRGAE